MCKESQSLQNEYLIVTSSKHIMDIIQNIIFIIFIFWCFFTASSLSWTLSSYRKISLVALNIVLKLCLTRKSQSRKSSLAKNAYACSAMLNLLYVTWSPIDQSDIFCQWGFTSNLQHITFVLCDFLSLQTFLILLKGSPRFSTFHGWAHGLCVCPWHLYVKEARGKHFHTFCTPSLASYLRQFLTLFTVISFNLYLQISMGSLWLANLKYVSTLRWRESRAHRNIYGLSLTWSTTLRPHSHGTGQIFDR